MLWELNWHDVARSHRKKGKKMTLEELLKESPEALKAVQDAIAKANDGQEDKTKHVRFADLSEG